jgi:sigma-E factor negative regulatory protein RseA
MDTLKRMHEHISALADGELPDGELELAMAALGTPAGRAAWEAYHLIGDTLRANASAVPSADFSRRLAARLAAEPALKPAASQRGARAVEQDNAVEPDGAAPVAAASVP